MPYLLTLVCLWCGRTVARAGSRSMYGHVSTKFSRMGRLLHFLTHGAPLVPFAGESSAITRSLNISTKIIVDLSKRQQNHNVKPYRLTKSCLLFSTISTTCQQNGQGDFASNEPQIRPNFSGSHTFSLTATAKIGPDPHSFTLARFWP